MQQGCPSGSNYLERDQLDGFIQRSWATSPGATVIKAHTIGPVAMTAIRTGEAKAVCTFRDPRDCVASDVQFLGRGLQASLSRVAMSLEQLRAYQTNDRILLVRYEQMMASRRREILRIADHLGVPLSDAALDRVDSMTNIDASRKLCGLIKARPANTVLHIASHKVDPHTHLHENHISNARPGRWRTEFSPEQGQALTRLFRHWLVQLGYETTDSLDAYLAQPAVSVVPIPAAYASVGGGVGTLR